MSLADFARADSVTEPVREGSPARCSFHQSVDPFAAWLESGLQCMAGKREFRLGRYHVARFANGQEYAAALAEFRRGVAEHQKTGFLAILKCDRVFTTAEEELRALGAAMEEAGLTGDANGLITGGTLSHAIEVACPVTGEDTLYEFFSVAFCQNAGEPTDPLYDPSLAAPFTAINTTSDAFAFARLVHGTAMRVWGRPVYEMIHDRDAVETLFQRCVTAWQNMSATTISNYSRIAVDPARGVHLSEDRQRWFAAHNDPVFAELKKCPFQHEMPVTYAARLTAKWSANLFDGQPYVPSRDGQSGGTPVSEDAFAIEGLSSELLQF